MKKILVLNSGSSSLKYQLFNVDGDKYDVVAKGKADRIGIHGSFVEIKITNGEKRTREVALPTHNEAIDQVTNELLNGASPQWRKSTPSAIVSFKAAIFSKIRFS